MKVGSKVGSNFGSVTVLVINYMDQRMELITSKLWATRSNRVRGTIHSSGQTPFDYGVYFIFIDQYKRISRRREGY